MELTILHLFPDFMSLYGEYANMAVLRRYLEAMAVKVTVRAVNCEDTPDFSDADLIYMGAGTERKQKTALEKLLPHGPELKAAVDGGALLFFTGNAMETLGASITDAKGKVWQGLGLADFASEETDRRETGDVLAETSLWDAPVVGFMNKCSAAEGIRTPLLDCIRLGCGNGEDRELGEGFAAGNILATHITGPVLVKNPAFLDFLTRRLFERKGWDCPETMPALPHQREAYEATLRELKARMG